MKVKLSAEDGWEETKAEQDGIRLINMIDRLMRARADEDAAKSGTAEPGQSAAMTASERLVEVTGEAGAKVQAETDAVMPASEKKR